MSLEKLLKAVYIKMYQEHSPKTHNLVLLSDKLSIELSNEDKLFLMLVNKFNIGTRIFDTYFKELSDNQKTMQKIVDEQNKAKEEAP